MNSNLPLIAIIIVGTLCIVSAQQQQQEQQNAWAQGSQDLIRSFSTHNSNNNNQNSNQRRKNQRPLNVDDQNDRFGGSGRNRHGSSSSSDTDATCNLNYQFDYFVLAIQWPSSFCLEKQRCNHTIAQQHKWLIHGLWPNQYPQQAIGRRNRRTVTLIDDQKQQQRQQQSKKYGSGSNNPNTAAATAEYCCGPKYDQSIMHQGNLYNELLEKWPTLHPGNYHHGFWKHEWEKHGTCARNVRPLKNQRKYFETILGLYNQFNLSTTSFQNGQHYDIGDVHRNLRKNIGDYKIRLECSLVDDYFSRQKRQQQQNRNRNQNRERNQSNNNGDGSQISVFSEIHICLNKTLHPIDCIRRDDYQCRNRILFP
mgnify:FL=1